jgi:hypothetical protein
VHDTRCSRLLPRQLFHLFLHAEQQARNIQSHPNDEYMPVTSLLAATDDRSQRGRRFRRIEEFYNRRTFLYPTPHRRLLFEIKLEKMRIEKQKRLMLRFVSYAPPIYGE